MLASYPLPVRPKPRYHAWIGPNEPFLQRRWLPIAAVVASGFSAIGCASSTNASDGERRSGATGIPRSGAAPALAGSAANLERTQRVEEILGKLSLEEKLTMLGGTATNFDTAGVSRADLSVEPLAMTDGPLGIRRYDGAAATALPAGISLASTFSEDLALGYGRAVAREAKHLGRNVLLGPCVNIARVPHGGRNFESYGEDPYLASRIAAEYVRGVRAEGVVATIKHFAANNQETERTTVNVVVDERTLREIYLPAFESAIGEGGAEAVMCSYNKLNGPWACENPHLLREILRDTWGFRGLVMSDWGATHSTAAALRAGLDLEMGQADFLQPARVEAALALGEISPSAIDDAVRHQLWVTVGLEEFSTAAGSPGEIVEQTKNLALAHAGIVLLKNEGSLLPLQPGELRRLAVIGPLADVYAAGGGSSLVPPLAATTPLAGIRASVGAGTEILYVADETGAAEAAASADAALLFLGETDETEGRDRDRLTLPESQVSLLRSVLAVNPRTVVVLVNGAPLVVRPWVDEVPALVEAWYGGQEQGHAIADVLFGVVSPSGHLPVTFPKRWEDCPAFGHFPGTGGDVHYAEGLLVGYRHFDTQGIDPEFPFGHGLAYVDFEYSKLSIDEPTTQGGASVRVSVRNLGSRPAEEVVQVYLSASESRVTRPARALVAFRRVLVPAASTVEVALGIAPRAFSYFDTESMSWVLESGRFELAVGRSSRDLRLRGTVVVR